MHPFIHLGFVDIPTYWVFGMLGLCVVMIYLWRYQRNYSIEKDDLFHLFLYGIIGGIIGAKIFFLLSLLPKLVIHYKEVQENPEIFLFLLKNGWVFYGGLLGGMWMVYRYIRRFHLDIKQTTALLVPAIPLFHSFGRVGCYFAGCCGGNFFIPIQLVEASFNLILFISLLLYQRYKEIKEKVLEIYLLSYAIFRFMIEFLREDSIRGIYLFSTSQWISLLIIGVIVFRTIKKRKEHGIR